MGKKPKLSTSEVANYLRESKVPVTKKKIAREFNCSPGTVNGCLRRMRKNDGVPVLPSRLGVFITDHVKHWEGEKGGKIVANVQSWMLGVLKGLILLQQVARKQFLEAAKIALKRLPKNEAKELRETMYQLASIASAAEVAGLLEEPEEIETDKKA